MEKQLALYFETAQLTGRIVALQSWDEKFREQTSGDRARFWELYWSELSMVESHEVEISMVAFGTSLKKLDALTPTSGPPASTDMPGITKAQQELQTNAYELAHAIRSSIESSWGIAKISPASDQPK